MRRRSIRKFGPGLEQFEAKQLLSAVSLTTHGVATNAAVQSSAQQSAGTPRLKSAAPDSATNHSHA